MIDELTDLLPDFPGPSNLTRCFAHIINLVAKTAIRVFDLPRTAGSDMDEAEKLLRDLAKDIDIEDLVTQANLASLDATDLNEEEEFAAIANSDEGWIDERMVMNVVDRAELDASVMPVRLVLVKLRKFAFTVLHSSTLLLPQWEELLGKLDLAERIMPRDVTTRWNSTYDMLVFAYEYRKAIDILTGDKSLGLRQYELSDDDWKVVKQLIGVLRVRLLIIVTF
ncbi:hypothetical protein BJ912DRAFT_859835 [Pholiota molesta]|nr:hypothetical protein BJ912DRAFT_859835 [Pholiota molesta]